MFKDIREHIDLLEGKGYLKRIKEMRAVWDFGQTSLTKIFIMANEDVNVHVFNQMVYAMAFKMDSAKAVAIVLNAHSDILDHASPTAGYGSELDTTRRLREECGKDRPEEVSSCSETVEMVNCRWKSIGLV